MNLQSKKDKNQESESHGLKDVIQHRPPPRKFLSVKQKMENLKSCIDKIQYHNDAKNRPSNDHRANYEIKSSEKAPVEKKKPGKRGRKRKIDL